MASPQVKLVCHGCGWIAPPNQPLAFRCGNVVEGDDVDHLVEVHWDSHPRLPDYPEHVNPFIHFRHQAYSYAKAIEHGLSDEDYVAIVDELNTELAARCMQGFRTTPFKRNEALGVWIKNESGNVAGSHKARHLFGLAVLFAVAERAGFSHGRIGTDEQPLAIASCGNAALAAATIARAVERPLQVFIPEEVDEFIENSLNDDGATIVRCERKQDAPPGDPCFSAFREAVAAGATPFTCQGSENGLTIDGGMTLGFELAEQCAHNEVALDHLFVQVGGGALGSSVCHALNRAAESDRGMPAIHAVQTVGCQPLVHAWRALANALRCALPSGSAFRPKSDADLAGWTARHFNETIATSIFERAVRNRSKYMQPVPTPTQSIASGILDDETYDWFVLCRTMIETGGWPVVVSETELKSAQEKATALSPIPVSATGAAGLAAALKKDVREELGADAEIGVFLTGQEYLKPIGESDDE